MCTPLLPHDIKERIEMPPPLKPAHPRCVIPATPAPTATWAREEVAKGFESLRTSKSCVQVPDLAGSQASQALGLFRASTRRIPGPIGRVLLLHRLRIDQLLTLRSCV
jgi:hypothetical protein